MTWLGIHWHPDLASTLARGTDGDHKQEERLKEKI